MAVVAVALLLRVGLVAATPGFQPAYDAADYHRIALAISQTGGYPPTTYAAPGSPSAFRPPAWPYAVAATKVVGGPGWTAGRLLGAALGAVAVLLVFLIGSQVWGRRTGLVAAGLTAVFPPMLFADTALLSEALFVPLTLGVVWALLRARRSDRALAWLAVAGALAGLAVLTRTAGLVLLAPLVVAAWHAGGGRRDRLRNAVVAAAVVGMVLMPWAIRNAVAFDAFVPVSTQSGWTLAGTYNPEAAEPGQYEAANRIPSEVAELRPIVSAALNEAEMDARLRAAARQFMAERPTYVLTAVSRNTQRLWASGPPDQRWLTRLSHAEMGAPERWDGLLAASALLSFLLGAAGVVVLIRRWRRSDRPGGGPWWLWTIPLLLWLSTVIVTGAPRYRVAIDPFVLLLAAVAVAAAAGRLAAARASAGAEP